MVLVQCYTIDNINIPQSYVCSFVLSFLFKILYKYRKETETEPIQHRRHTHHTKRDNQGLLPKFSRTLFEECFVFLSISPIGKTSRKTIFTLFG